MIAYKSGAERFRELFLTRSEAIDTIAQLDNCSSREATRQLTAALADNAIRGLHWEDRSDNYDSPPQNRDFWQKVRVRRGKVFDPSTGRYRTLLIPKLSILDVFEFRPGPPDLASVASAAPERARAGPTTNTKGGRHSAKDEIYQALDQLSQRGHRVKDMAPMKLANLVARESGKPHGEAGWATRTVLEHIQRWRAEH